MSIEIERAQAITWICMYPVPATSALHRDRLASPSSMCRTIYIVSDETVQMRPKLRKLATLTIIDYSLV